MARIIIHLEKLVLTGLVPICLLCSTLHSQFALTYDPSVPVTRDGVQLDIPWGGGINFAQFSNIDIDADGDQDLFMFDKSGNEVVLLINDGSPGVLHYTHTREFDHIYPFNELHDWALLRDYNCDGKPDIWSYSLGGARVFKNTSNADGPSFELVTDLVLTNYQPTIANLYITQVDIPGIEDIDNDGDLDLITFSIFGSYMEYHRNLSMELYGTCDSLTYEVRNRCWGYFSENVNNNSVNLDDPCSFNVPNPELPVVIEQVTAQLAADHHKPMADGQAKKAAHVGSTILPIDLDGDEVMDLILGDLLYNNLVALSNDGSVDDNHMASQDSLFPIYDVPANLELFPGAFYVDVNNDAKRDLIVGTNSTTLAENVKSVWCYFNTGTDAAPVFDYQMNNLFQDRMLDFGEGARPVPFDYNGDGLMDLIVANYGYFQSGGNYPSMLAVLENTGTANSPAFEQVITDYEDLSTSGIGQSMHPAFGDIDNDGDMDMYIGDLTGFLHYYKNISTGPVADFVLTTPQVPNDGGVALDVGQFATPQFFDVDDDGKLDLLIGERNGNINYYHNVGTLTAPSWHLENDSIGGVVVAEWWNVSGYSVPHMFINDAGELELLVGSESGWIYNYTNINGNLNGVFTEADTTWQDIKEGGHSSVVLYHFNGDGYRDAVTGNYRAGLGYWRNDFAIAISDAREST